MAKAVFAGQVKEIREDKSYVPDANYPRYVIPGKRYVVRFRAERKFKGVRGSSVSLYSFQGEGACPDIKFVKGERYLVFASPYEGRFRIDPCGSSGKLSERGKEYRTFMSSRRH